VTFERIAPQVVRHSEGYQVQIADRWHLAYVEIAQAALVDADLEGPVVRLQSESVMWTEPSERKPTDAERLMILDRVVQGVLAMGDGCVVNT
jgi:hypothetical protein